MKIKVTVSEKLPKKYDPVILPEGMYSLGVLMGGREFLKEFNDEEDGELQEFEDKYFKGDVEAYRKNLFERINEANGNVHVIMNQDEIDTFDSDEELNRHKTTPFTYYKLEVDEFVPKVIKVKLPETMITKERAAEERGYGIYGDDVPALIKKSPRDIMNEKKAKEDFGGTGK